MELKITLSKGQGFYFNNGKGFLPADHFEDQIGQEGLLGPHQINLTHWLERSSDLISAGSIEEGLAMAQESAIKAPNILAFPYEIARAHFEKGDLPQAKNACKEALRLNPNFAEAHALWGDIHRVEGQAQTAEEAYRKALEINPQLEWAKINLAYLLSQYTNSS